MAPLGDGFYLNRRTRRLIRIWEHAEDAVKYPKKFKSQAVSHLDPVKNRDEIVIHTVRVGGFIRVRHWRDHLGFQFWGDPDGALADLRRFGAQRLGPASIITATDFSTGLNIIALWAVIRGAPNAYALGLAKAPPASSTSRSRRT